MNKFPDTRRRVLAGSSLGLAGVGAALVLALGGSAAPPASALSKHVAGPLTVQIADGGVIGNNQKLAAMGIHEQIAILMRPGTAAPSGAINCDPRPVGANLPGPQVKAILGTDDNETIASGNTGAGSWHLAGCHLYDSSTTGGNLLYGESWSDWGGVPPAMRSAHIR